MRTAIKSEVVDYILKPIDAQDLNNAIAAAIEQLEKVSSPDTENLSAPVSSVSSVISDIKMYIDRNYKSDISLAELSDTFYIR